MEDEVKTDAPAILRCKICVIGDATIGKTALVDVYTKGNSKFPKNYNMVGPPPPPSPPPHVLHPSLRPS